MADEKPLTRSDLVAALKEAGVATRDDVRQIVGEEIAARGLSTRDDVHTIVLDAADAVLEGVERLLEGFATRDDLKTIDPRLKKLETGHSHIKDQIEGLKAEFSVTPSRQELNDLKVKVDRYHPSN